MIDIKFYIKRSKKTPFFRLDSNHDTYFFPFFVCDEFNSTFTYNKINFQRVYSGNKTTFLKLMDWEQQMVPYDPILKKEIDTFNLNKNTVFKRKFNIGTFFIGKALSLRMRNDFSKKYGFVHQKISSTISVYFNSENQSISSFIWDKKNKQIKKENLYLFFSCPELALDDILRVATINILLDIYGNFVCCIVDFISLTEEFNERGLNLDSVVQFGAPGEIPLIPEVKEILEYNPEIPSNKLPKKEILFFEPEKLLTYKNENNEDVTKNLYVIFKDTKQVYIDKKYFENIKPIKNIQLKIKGECGFGGIKIIGRKILKNTKDEIIYGRPQNLFVHKLEEPVFNIFDKTRKFNNNYCIISDLRAEREIWTDVQRLESTYSNINPDVKRPSQIILKKDDLYNDFIPKKDNKIIDFFPLIGKKEYLLTNKNKLVGKNAIAYSKYSDFQLKEEDIIENNKLIVYENDYIQTDKITAEEFINFNPFLIDNVQYLQIGQSLLSNNKGEAQSAVNTSIGLGSDFLFKLSRKLFALIRPSAIASNFFQWSPNSWFVGKKILKLSSKINLMFSREIIDFFNSELPKGRISNNFYIPLDFFMTAFRNQFSRFLATEEINKFFNMNLTEKAYLKKKNSDNIELVDTSTLRKGTHVISNKPFKTAETAENEGFIIDAIEVTCLGQRVLQFSFLDTNNNLSNFYRIKAQALYSNNISEIKTTIQLSNFNENFSSFEKFIDTALNQNRKNALELSYYFEKIKEGTKQDQLKQLNDILQDSMFFPETNFNSEIPYNNSKTDNRYEIDLNKDFVLKLNFNTAWNFIKNYIRGFNTTPIIIFENILEAKTWLLNKYTYIFNVICKHDLFYVSNNYLWYQNQLFNTSYVDKRTQPKKWKSDNSTTIRSWLESSIFLEVSSPFQVFKEKYPFPVENERKIEQTSSSFKNSLYFIFKYAFSGSDETTLYRKFVKKKYDIPLLYGIANANLVSTENSQQIVLQTQDSLRHGGISIYELLLQFKENLIFDFDETNGNFLIKFNINKITYWSDFFDRTTYNLTYLLFKFNFKFNVRIDKKSN